MIENAQPTVALVDVYLLGLNGLELARILKRRTPRVRVIVLNAETDHEQALIQAMMSNAAAYIEKTICPNDLAQVVLDVAQGRYPIIEAARARLDEILSVVRSDQTWNATDATDAMLSFAPLTTQELVILDCIVRGHSNKDIARLLSISNQTVKNHVSAILTKLGARDRTMAVIVAIARGWVRIGYTQLPGRISIRCPEPPPEDDSSVDAR